MAKIKKIIAREIVDGSGNMAVEGKLILDNGVEVVTSVASSNKSLAYQSVDMDSLRAVNYINDLIGPKLVGISPLKQSEIDGWLLKADNTKNKSKLGTNTILIISQLISLSGAADSNTSLFRYLNSIFAKRTANTLKIERVPTPIFTILKSEEELINGKYKEFFVIPSTSSSYQSSLPMGLKIYNYIRTMFSSNELSVNSDIIEAILKTFELNNYKLGRDLFIGIDFGGVLKKENITNTIDNLLNKYLPLVIVDPVSYDATDIWKNILERISKETYLVSSATTASNYERIKKAVSNKICSSFLIKPVEVGTITEVFDLIGLIKKNDLGYIISSGDRETNDTFLVDLGAALQSEFIKIGPLSGGEYTTKYNRMGEIENEITNHK